MSRAFTKEPDADAPIELPELPLGVERNIVTMRGLQLIEAEIENLQILLGQAMARDDKMEAAKARRDLIYWTARRDTAELIEAGDDSDKVQFGTKVTIEDENGKKIAYCIVGLDEADPVKGLLSYISPLARALIGKRVGDFVETEMAEYEIMKIEKC